MNPDTVEERHLLACARSVEDVSAELDAGPPAGTRSAARTARPPGRALPDIAGVDADLADDELRLDLRIVVADGHRATEVGAAVQRAVATAVPAAVGRPVAGVAVHVVGFQLP